MAAAGRQPTQHRRTGAQLGYHGDVVEAHLVCRCCSATQTEPLDAEAKLVDALAGISCMWCGRVGQMRMVGVL